MSHTHKRTVHPEINPEWGPVLCLGQTEKHSPTHPLRVFVVEDDLELSAIIDRVLRSIDRNIILDWATSAETALTLVKAALKHCRTERKNQPTGTEADSPESLPYDLIIADIFLDGKTTGIDFWHTCQELFPSIPVLVTSALELDQFFKAIGRENISPPYLQKPFSIAACRQVFEGLLSYADKQRQARDHSALSTF